MEARLQAGVAPGAVSRAGSLLVVGSTLAVAVRALPLGRGYLEKLVAGHAPATLAAAAAVATVGWGLLWLGLARHPVLALTAVGTLALVMVVLSGNAGALAIASVLIVVTFCAGDLISRLLLNAQAGPGDLASVFAAGLVGAGLSVLVLGEFGLLSRTSLVALLGLGVCARIRRLPALRRLVLSGARLPWGDAPRWLEAGWLSFSILALLAVWAGALGPDVSWDGLAYHLPEARDVATVGRVLARADLAPQSLLWRNHDTFLSVAFFFGGERVARILQFAVGVGVFGASLALVRRLRMGGVSALVVLSLAAFPTAMLQLRATYADWPAALLVVAAADQLVAGRAEGGRLRLAAFLFGGAVTTKVFALAAAPALAILLWGFRPKARQLALACACFLLALGPWLAWSARRAGSIVAPYARSPRELVARVASGHYATTSPASGEVAPPVPASERVARLVRLPYDLVFHSSHFEANGDGYNGIFVLVSLVGLAGWDRRHLALFGAAALPVVVPWSQLYLPSVRYLFPLFPLYAVFVARGLDGLTRRFSGRAGAAAGLALLAAAAAFPVQFGSSGIEWRAALGRMSREEVLAARLPDYSLRGLLGPGDRVVFLGENDRFYCPASTSWRDDYLPVAAWGRDPAAWRRGLDELGITHVLLRSDRRKAEGPLLEALGDRLELAGQEGPAILYRVRRGGPTAVQ